MKIALTIGLLVLIISGKRMLQSPFLQKWPSAPSIYNPPIYNRSFEDSLRYVNQFTATPTYQKIRTSFLTEVGCKARVKIIDNNIKLINRHNRNPFRSYNMKINEFILLTPREFK